jgi:hypothetical protein
MILDTSTVQVPTDVNRSPSRITSQSVFEFRSLHKTPSDLGLHGPLSEWGIQAIVKKYAYQAKLKDVTSQTLHQSFAKKLVDAGMLLDQVATLLGYERLDTTWIYTQPSERDLEWAVRRAAGEIVREDG